MPVSLWCVLKTGCVRNSLVRRSSCGMAGSMPFSKGAISGSAWPGLAKMDQSRVRSARVVVSSSEMQMYSPQCLRRLARSACPLATSASVASPVRRESVSKKALARGCQPSCSSPFARIAV
jgi:hypothetical protein